MVRIVLALAGAALFGVGFLVGSWSASSPTGALDRRQPLVAPIPEKTPEDEASAAAPKEKGAPPALNLKWLFGAGTKSTPHTRDEWFTSLREAVARRDRGSAEEALRALGGTPLSDAELDEWTELLRSSDGESVHGAVYVLASLGGAEGLSRVLDFVKDENLPLDLRRDALHALDGIPPERRPEAAEMIARFLESVPSEELARSATHVFGELHGEGATKALLGLLGDERPMPRDVILQTLGDFGKPEDAPALLQAANGDWSRDERENLLRSAMRMLSRSGDPERLLELLATPPAGVSRQVVARALGDASDRLGTGILVDALARTAGDPRAQEEVARALARRGGAQGLETLVAASEDPAFGLDRRVFARALTEYRGREGVPMMLDLLRGSTDREVVEPLARSIFRSGDDESTAELLRLLETDADVSRRRAIAQSLEEASGSNVERENLLSLLRGASDPDVARGLGRALERLYPKSGGDEARELFEGAENSVERMALARLLERNIDDGGFETLSQALRTETDNRARWEYARLLGRQGNQGVQEIAEFLRAEPDESRRHNALWGLEAAEPGAATSARDVFLDVAGRDPSPSIRGQAAEILARRGERTAIPALAELLQSEPHPDVRARIERALRDLEGITSPSE